MKNMNKYDLQQLTREIQSIVTSISNSKPGVIAAFSCGSFTRNDLVRGSDIDIGFIVADGLGGKKVHRKVIGGVLFEWAFMDKHCYEDIDSILKDAGRAHELALAKIWIDKDGLLKIIQKGISDRLQESSFIRERAESQYHIAGQNIERFFEAIAANDAPKALFHLLPAVRHLCAIPTAILNRPLTNCRAPLYCKRDAGHFGQIEYFHFIITILGSTNFSEKKSVDLLKMAHDVYENSGLPVEEIKTYRTHLERSDYLIEIGEFEIAVWPILFWVFGPLIIGEILNKEIRENILRNSFPIQEALGLHKIELLSARREAIDNAMSLGKDMITSAFSGTHIARIH